MQKYYEDSLDWANNPLYGWCNKNTKKDGSKYNLYTDGLKIYTTINSRMQQYAEEAVTEHLAELQGYFFKEKQGRKKAPYSFRLTQEQVDEILLRNIRQTDRYRSMRKAGHSEAEILRAFDVPHEMSVFSWEGEKDTVLSPLDSIRYYKHFLRAGFMSMNPHNGHVKAYVGGPNYHYFQYDMAMMGRRQVGSTIKPFLYTLAMENGFSPCDEVRHVEYTLLDENNLPWTPRNSNKKRYGEMVTIKWGLANSDNWVTAYLMSKLNPYALKRLIHSFGVRNQEIMPTVSLCLGPCEISVGEMVSAYTTFPNRGIRVAPLFVTPHRRRRGQHTGDILAGDERGHQRGECLQDACHAALRRQRRNRRKSEKARGESRHGGKDRNDQLQRRTDGSWASHPRSCRAVGSEERTATYTSTPCSTDREPLWPCPSGPNT